MAEMIFDLAGIFEQTFGYRSQAFEPEFDRVNGNKTPYRTEQGALGSPYYSADEQGREYFMPVTIKYPGTADAGGELKKWELPFPVITIASRKNIVETPLTERRGTVKELINTEDYEITIRGFIVATGNEFPESEVTTLRNIYEQNVALSIECPLTDIFLLRPDRGGSDQVVIKQLRLPEVTGIKNIRPYELLLVSDEPFSLESIS
jgi:hypothetical protein